MENLLDVVDVVGKAVEKYNGEKRYVSTGALAEDIIDDSKCEYYTYDKKPSRANLQVSEGDIIFAKMQGTKKTLIIDKDSSQNVFSTGFCALKPKNNKITTKCLYYLISSEIFLKNKDKNCSGATQKAITNEGLSKICIKLPQVEVQNKICNYLDRINNINKKYRKQIAFFDILIKARFVEMFGDPVTNCKKWETIKLKECSTKIGSGATPRGGKEVYIKDGISLIRSLNVYNNSFIYSNLAHINSMQAEELDNVTIENNDILLNITGASVARCCIVPVDVLPARVNQHVCIIRLNKGINSVFLNYQITSNSMQNLLIELASAGATREAITKDNVENLNVIIPPIDLQNQFATFVKHIDKLKFDVQKSLEKTQMLFDSLMQEYFG